MAKVKNPFTASLATRRLLWQSPRTRISSRNSTRPSARNWSSASTKKLRTAAIPLSSYISPSSPWPSKSYSKINSPFKFMHRLLIAIGVQIHHSHTRSPAIYIPPQVANRSPLFVTLLSSEGFEVLLLVDPIDEYAMTWRKEFDGQKLICVSKEHTSCNTSTPSLFGSVSCIAKLYISFILPESQIRAHFRHCCTQSFVQI